MVFWTLRLCIPLLLSWDFGVRPCMHTATSFWTCRVSSTFSLCGTSSGTSAPTLLAVLSQLFCQTELLRELFLPAVGYALVSWVLGSQSLAVLLWVLGSQSLAVLLSSRPFGACFIQRNPMISMPTSPSESLLLFTPWNQVNLDVTGFKNTQAYRDNRSCHFHAQLECSILCRCTESAAPALSRASPRRLNDAFNISSLAHDNRLCLTPRHAYRCLLRNQIELIPSVLMSSYVFQV